VSPLQCSPIRQRWLPRLACLASCCCNGAMWGDALEVASEQLLPAWHAAMSQIHRDWIRGESQHAWANSRRKARSNSAGCWVRAHCTHFGISPLPCGIATATASPQAPLYDTTWAQYEHQYGSSSRGSTKNVSTSKAHLLWPGRLEAQPMNSAAPEDWTPVPAARAAAARPPSRAPAGAPSAGPAAAHRHLARQPTPGPTPRCPVRWRLRAAGRTEARGNSIWIPTVAASSWQPARRPTPRPTPRFLARSRL